MDDPHKSTKPCFCQEVKQIADLERSSHLKYKSLQTKNKKKPAHEYAQTKGESLVTWKEYFRVNLEEYETVSNATIDESKIELRLKKLENKEAWGLGNASNELVKYGGQTPMATV